MLYFLIAKDSRDGFNEEITKYALEGYIVSQIQIDLGDNLHYRYNILMEKTEKVQI